jgi:hypothetical protein
MPISKDRFEEMGGDGDEGAPTPGTNAAKILEFLRAHPDKAFTQSEIAAETAVTSGSVGPTLVRLRKRGRVDHRGTYWRVSDHEQSLDAATEQAAATLRARETDEEVPQMSDWQEQATDPRDTRDEQ